MRGDHGEAGEDRGHRARDGRRRRAERLVARLERARVEARPRRVRFSYGPSANASATTTGGAASVVASDSHGVARAAPAAIAGGRAGEAVRDVGRHPQLGAHPAERLRPAGAVDVPVELVDRRVVGLEGHVVLGVADDVRLLAVHEVVGGDGDEQELAVLVGLGLERAGRARGIRHRLDVEVGGMPLVVERDRPADAAVLVELGEHRDERLGRRAASSARPRRGRARTRRRTRRSVKSSTPAGTDGDRLRARHGRSDAAGRRAAARGGRGRGRRRARRARARRAPTRRGAGGSTDHVPTLAPGPLRRPVTVPASSDTQRGIWRDGVS